LAYDRHVGPVLFAIVIGLVTGVAAIVFRELISFINLVLLVRVLGWAEATLPYGRLSLPLITGGGGLIVGLLIISPARPKATACRKSWPRWRCAGG
jgi:hypothetical protein